MKKKLAVQKIARDKRTQMKEKSKPLSVIMNRAQVAEAIHFPLRKLYRANIQPDFLDLKGAPLFRSDRLASIAELLRKPEAVA